MWPPYFLLKCSTFSEVWEFCTTLQVINLAKFSFVCFIFCCCCWWCWPRKVNIFFCVEAFRPQVQFGGLAPSCFVVKFRIMMIGENRFRFRSYVHVSGCIFVSHIDLNPANIWAIQGEKALRNVCMLYILPTAILNTKTQSRSMLSYIVHSLKYDSSDVESVYAIRSGNKCDVLSDVWFHFFGPRPQHYSLHGIIPSHFTFTIRWNSSTGKITFLFIFSTCCHFLKLNISVVCIVVRVKVHHP